MSAAVDIENVFLLYN